MDIQKEYEAIGEPYQPIFPAETASSLDRQETMDLLKEVERLAKINEYCNTEIGVTRAKIKTEQDTAEALRNKLSEDVRRKILIITIIGAIIGTIVIPIVLTLVFGAVAYFAAFVKIGYPDLTAHQEENNIAADAHIRDHVVPLQTRLEQLTAIQKDITQNGKLDWAIEIVGENLFYSSCIDDLYQLVKSRRADNLKEALNKYDDEQYKARMQEMQKATQHAAELAAKEAKKQTRKLGNIEWNTALTAWNTNKIKRNTRKR